MACLRFVERDLDLSIVSTQWLLLGFADVEGNYLIVRAYQYTDITSVTLLDAFAVPGVIGHT